MKLLEELAMLYPKTHEKVHEDLVALMDERRLDREGKPLTEEDVMLITYGDTVRSEKERPLKTLRRFLNRHTSGFISAVHILPMFTYSSDDGFSVIDYMEIDPAVGTWVDIETLAESHELMFDAVINHISKESPWFEAYKKGDPAFADFFIEYDETHDYSEVVRPRSSPLFHEYETSSGKKSLWTTFSEDQLDLNYSNPNVLYKVIKVLIEYARRGARFIRLDAVGFLWKASGNTSIHHEQTHRIIRVMKKVLAETVPGTKLITETNVPHEENIAYFGDGGEEADLVYQFPLPPLTLHGFLNRDASVLARWAESLEKTPPPARCTYFNFLASHDGIGMRPTESFLGDEDTEAMVEHTRRQGGMVSFKSNRDGSQSVYELNINYFDALHNEGDTTESHIRKFLTAHGILLAFKGVPGIYIHSLLGSRGDYKGAVSSGMPRRINREKLNETALEDALSDENSLRRRIFTAMRHMIRIRRETDAFHPEATQTVRRYDPRIFAFERTTGTSTVLVLANLSEDDVFLETGFEGRDLITDAAHGASLTVSSHEIIWLRKEESR